MTAFALSLEFLPVTSLSHCDFITPTANPLSTSLMQLISTCNITLGLVQSLATMMNTRQNPFWGESVNSANHKTFRAPTILWALLLSLPSKNNSSQKWITRCNGGNSYKWMVVCVSTTSTLCRNSVCALTIPLILCCISTGFCFLISCHLQPVQLLSFCEKLEFSAKNFKSVTPFYILPCCVWPQMTAHSSTSAQHLTP